MKFLESNTLSLFNLINWVIPSQGLWSVGAGWVMDFEFKLHVQVTSIKAQTELGPMYSTSMESELSYIIDLVWSKLLLGPIQLLKMVYEFIKWMLYPLRRQKFPNDFLYTITRIKYSWKLMVCKIISFIFFVQNNQ